MNKLKLKKCRLLSKTIQAPDPLIFEYRFQEAHALSGYLRMNHILKALLFLRQKLYWTEGEFKSIKVLKNTRLTLFRLQLVSYTGSNITLTNGALRIIFLLNQVLTDFTFPFTTDEISGDFLNIIKSHEKFDLEVKYEIRNHIKNLPSVYLFTKHIKSCTNSYKTKQVNMYDIFQHLITRNDIKPLIWLFVGNLASTARNKLESTEDICYSCERQKPCTKLLQITSDRKNLLLHYRDSYCKDILNLINNNEEDAINQLKEDPLLIKFLVPYSLVVENKSFLIDIGILKETPILRKDQGKYCPYDDYWAIPN